MALTQARLSLPYSPKNSAGLARGGRDPGRSQRARGRNQCMAVSFRIARNQGCLGPRQRVGPPGAAASCTMVLAAPTPGKQEVKIGKLRGAEGRLRLGSFAL